MVKRILSLVVLFVVVAAVPAAGAGDEYLEIDDDATYRLLSSGFIPNAGQYDPTVEYILQHQGTTIFFTRDGLVLTYTPENASTDVIRQSFAGASSDTHLSASGQREGVVNYYVGNDSSKWLSDIPVYSEVIYEDLYPGIDLVYTEESGRLKREFSVSPGADPSQIELLYEGESEPHVDEDGVLRFTSPAGEMLESPLVCWQVIGGERVDRAAGYVVEGGSVRIRVEEYDAGHGLIIDPELVYSSYLGGGVSDWGSALAGDGAGGVWVTGGTYSADFPVLNAYQSSYGGGDCDVFVSHFSSSGTLLSSTYLGGWYNDEGTALAGDGSGGVWVTGETWSGDFPTLNAYQSEYGGDLYDAFVSHFSSSGALLSSTYLGGEGWDEGTALAGDGSGGVWVTGYTYSYDFPTLNAYQNNSGGSSDAFVSHFSSSGTLLSSTCLGGKDRDEGRALAGDGAGGVWVTGWTYSTDFPTLNAYQNNRGGYPYNNDAFVSHFSSSGTLLSSTYLGGKEGDEGCALAGDGSGGVWVTGYTYSYDFPTLNAYQSKHGGSYQHADAFVSHFSSTGTLLSSTYLGGWYNDEGTALAGDGSGGVWVTGYTYSYDFPTLNAYQSCFGGGYTDTFVSHFSSSGALLSSTYLGGWSVDEGYTLAGDGAGGIWVMGMTCSSDFPILNAYQSTYGGGDYNPYGGGDGYGDIFVSHFSSTGTLLSSTYLGGKSRDHGTALAGDGSGGVWVTGWTYSTDFPVLNAYQSSHGGGSKDIFIAKFSERYTTIYNPRIFDTQTPEFLWSPVPEADGYRLYISKVTRKNSRDCGEKTQITSVFDSKKRGITITSPKYRLPAEYALDPYAIYVWNYVAEKDGAILGDHSSWEYFTVVDKDAVLMGVPYVHQVYDTYEKGNGTYDKGSSFFGDEACGPTSAVMVLGYYGKLDASTRNVDYPEKHTTSYGKYVNNSYEYNEREFPGGAYNYWITAGNTNQVYNIIDYLKDHDLDAGFVETPSKAKAESLVKREIKNGNPVIARTQIDGQYPHYVVIIGYQEGGDDFLYIVNDPIGNRNYPLYYPDDVLWGDYTGIYAPYTYEKMRLDIATRGLVWVHPESSQELNALFESDQVTGTAPLVVQFTDTSTGSPTSWSWDFGDEETHTDQNPVHIYKNPGEYDVSFTVQRGSASDSVTKTGLIIVDEPNPGLNIELEYQNSVLLGDGDTVEVRVRTTGSNGIPRVSNIMVKAPGESAERARAAEYTYSFVPDHSGTYRVAVSASLDDGTELLREATIEVVDDLSFAKKRADDLKSLANDEIDQAENMAAERSIDLIKSMFLDHLLTVEGVTSAINVFFDGITPLVADIFHDTVGDLSGEYVNYFCGHLKGRIEGKYSDVMGDAIFGDDDSYLINSASSDIENLCNIKERRDALDRTTGNFVEYIEANPDQFRDNSRINKYVHMYSSGIINTVESHNVIDIKIWRFSYDYSYLEAYFLYEAINENTRFVNLALGAAIIAGATVALSKGIGAPLVAALIPVVVTIIKSVSSFDTFVSIVLSILLISNVPIIADDVVYEHQNSILGIEHALSGISAEFAALSVSDVSAGETASITSSGDVFIIGPSGKVETILLGGGYYTPTDPGTYRAYSYNHGNGPFSQIEGCDIAVKAHDVKVNATYTITEDLASIHITAENYEDTSIGDMYLTTSILDSDGNLMKIYDESFGLDPLQNTTYEYEVDVPELNTFYVAETILSVNYLTVLDSAGFIIDIGGGEESETAVILSVGSPQVFPYGEDIPINLTVRSFKDALPITLEIPEFEYSTTEYITGEETIQVVLPGQDPEDYMTSVYLYGSDGNMYDADIIRFAVQAEGTGFLSIESRDALFPAGETINIPLVFTDVGLDDLEGEVFVQVRGPEDEIFDAVVTGRDGNYQFTFTPPVSGTYIATAEAYKDGYYIYGDQVTFISGEMSPLKLAVGADEEVLYVNVTANGLPVGANVTMTVNGTETAKTAVSGIATFPNVENYRLKAEMLFFAPAEFSHMAPEARLSLKSNRTVLDQAVVFNASASQDSDGWIVEYHWDFGDGHEETTTSGYALHPFNATGHYTVNLTVVDNDGLCSSVTRDIAVIERSTPVFEISEKSIYVGYMDDVSIQVADLDEVSWLRMVVEFDPGIVEGIEVSEVDVALIPSSVANGVIIVESDVIEPLSGSASFASIKLKGVSEGSTTINITAVCRDVDGYSTRPIVSGNAIQILPGAPLLADFTADSSMGTAPFTVQFTDTSTGNPTSWSWFFGDGGESFDQNPTHIYTAPGTYTVSLTATNAGGSNTETRVDYIMVMTPPPVANFTANVTAGPAPLTVRFTDTSIGEVSTWSWSFGDGSVSTKQNPIHTYTTPGNYTVELSVDGESLTCTKSGYIKVTPILFGDADGDGLVNQADTLLVLQQVVGAVAKPDPGAERFRKIDVNQNGVIDVGDALFIAQYNVDLRDVWFEVL